MKTDRHYTKVLNTETECCETAGRSVDEVAVYDLTQDIPDKSEDSCVSLESLETAQTHYKCLSKPSFSYKEDIMLWCAYMVQQSPLAKALWNAAEKKGWRFGLTDLGGRSFHMDIPEKTFYLDHFSLTPAALGRSVYFKNLLLCNLIRVLRDTWHEEHWGALELQYSPENTLMMERIRAADCDTCVVLSCWEWRGAGYADIWRHLIGSEDGDMALAFSQFLEHSPTSHFNAAPIARAFKQWFKEESRVNACDHVTLESLDDRLSQSREQNPFGTERLDGDAVEKMAELPDGVKYLSGQGHEIIRDPYYAGLNDTINQTHLLHLVYDLEVTMVHNVPFRDKELAHRMFPQDD